MGEVWLDKTMSLDGLITGPDPGLDQPLGEGGDRLFDHLGLGVKELERVSVVKTAGATHLRFRVVKETR